MIFCFGANNCVIHLTLLCMPLLSECILVDKATQTSETPNPDEKPSQSVNLKKAKISPSTQNPENETTKLAQSNSTKKPKIIEFFDSREFFSDSGNRRSELLKKIKRVKRSKDEKGRKIISANAKKSRTGKCSDSASFFTAFGDFSNYDVLLYEDGEFEGMVKKDKNPKPVKNPNKINSKKMRFSGNFNHKNRVTNNLDFSERECTTCGETIYDHETSSSDDSSSSRKVSRSKRFKIGDNKEITSAEKKELVNHGPIRRVISVYKDLLRILLENTIALLHNFAFEILLLIPISIIVIAIWVSVDIVIKLMF